MFKFSREHLSLVCDVGSGSVGAGLFLFSEEPKPLLLGNIRIPLKIPANFAPLQEKQVLELIEIACRELLALRTSWPVSSLQRKKIDSMEVFLASPWHIARTSPVTVEKDSTFTLDKDFLDEILAKESEKFKSELAERKIVWSNVQSIQIIERAMTNVRLNGYPTASPFGKRANEAECAVYLSAVSESFLKSVREIARRTLHHDSVAIHSFPLAYFRAIDRMFLHGGDCLLFDIAGESTDISFAHQGALETIVSIPIGKNTLIRSIADRYGVTPEIALSYLHLVTDKTADPELIRDIETRITEYRESWSNALAAKIPPARFKHVPECFVVCDADMTPLAKASVQDLVDPEHSRLIFLSHHELARHIEYAKHTVPDPFLSLGAISLRSTRS